jgi:phage terminase large subunit-like protein
VRARGSRTPPRKPPRRKPSRSSTIEQDPVTAYARDVLAERIIAGPLVRGACERHLKDLKRKDIVWDLASAQRAMAFFPGVLKLNAGKFESTPFKLEPWQAFVVGSIFGWKRRNGQRRFRWAYIETGKGSGKSPLAAGVGLYMLTADGEARAEVYAAATKKDQAMILFRDAVAMFQLSPELRARLTPSGGNPVWQLTYLTKASWFKPISNDDGQSGPRPSCALIDELHEHPDAKTVEMLEAGFKFRENPLMFMITNSGSDQTSVCWKYHDLIARIVAGEVEDDEVFGYVCALDEGDDPFEDESCWIKANPSLGVTIRVDYLRSRIAKARNLPDKRNECLRLNFCVWTDAEAAWMTKPVWAAVQKPWKLESLRGKKAWLGADLAIRNDLVALAGVVELDPDDQQRRRFAAWCEFWLPREKLRAKEDTDSQPYSTWVEQGHLHLSEGNFVRQEFVAKRMVEIADIFDLQAVAYDEYAVKWLQIALDDLGARLPLIEHPQGYRRGKRDEDAIRDAKMRGEPPPPGLWMPDSIQKTEELIVETLIEVNPNPILTWNIASATFERDAQDNRKLSKRKSTGKIDGAVALVMACGAAMNAPTIDGGSVYRTRGAIVM